MPDHRFTRDPFAVIAERTNDTVAYRHLQTVRVQSEGNPDTKRRILGAGAGIAELRTALNATRAARSRW
jgi:hypothetical protein